MSEVKQSGFEKSIDELSQKLELRGKEIDSIQIELSKKSKWWLNPSNLISITAVLLSVFATIYSIQQEKKKDTNQIKLRVKEIVQRINEIQSSFISKKGQDLANSHQLALPELSTLLDEAISISEKNKNIINDSEYFNLVNTAYLTQKTENIKFLIESGLDIVDDVSTEFGLLNSLAKYHYEIEGNPLEGRKSIMLVIEKTKNQQVGELMKIANIALEYYYWGSFEFSAGNYKVADSTLQIAENMVINIDEPWKFSNYPVVDQIKLARDFFDSNMANRNQ